MMRGVDRSDARPTLPLSEADALLDAREAELERIDAEADRTALTLTARLKAIAEHAAALEASLPGAAELAAVVSHGAQVPGRQAADERERAAIEAARKELLARRRAWVEAHGAQVQARAEALAALSAQALQDERALAQLERKRRQQAIEAKAQGAKARVLVARLDPESESNLFTGFSPKLEDGGVFVATLETFAPETRVQVRCAFEGAPEVTFWGHVLFSREANPRTPEVFPGVGVSFGELTADEWRAVSAFAAARPPMFFPAEVWIR